MAKASILREVTTTNTFLTFSQWSEDLTLQNALGDAYRIVPSRFAAFYINDPTQVPDYLNAKFEHSCAALRHFLSVDTNSEIDFTPKDASLLFWDAMSSLVGGSSFSNMVYAGEVDIQGTNYIDGVTYSEWYAVIPSTAKKMKDWAPASNVADRNALYSLTDAGASAGKPFRWSDWPDGSADRQSSLITDPLAYNSGSIQVPAVFTCADNQTRYSSLNTLDSLHQRYMQDVLYNRTYFQEDNVNYFDANCIALFYDIVAKDEDNNYQYLYTAVPMGVFVIPDADQKIHHVVSSSEVYGQGTSHGLRVTTKFSAESLVSQTGSVANNPSSSQSTVSASVEEILPAMSAVMDRFNAAADALNDYISVEDDMSSKVLAHMNSYKDNRVNIPYIREIKGEGDTTARKYWFVNGRSTGVPVVEENHVVIDNDLDAGTLATILGNIIQQHPEYITNNLGDTIEQYFDSHDVTNTLDPTNQSTREWIEYVRTSNMVASGETPSETIIENTATSISNTQDFQDIVNGNSIFEGFSSLTRLPRLELSNATSLNKAFLGCSSLSTINISDTISCATFNEAFKNCSNLVRLHVDATSAVSFENAFIGCNRLTDIRIDNINTENLHKLDLRSTSCSFGSLYYIVNNLQARPYEEIVESTTQLGGYIKIMVPSSIDISDTTNPYIADLIYLARQNKSIDLEITH